MGIRRSACIFLAAGTLLFAQSCKNGEDRSAGRQPGRLKVAVSLFPLYDFASIVGGGLADVTLLLPPGLEPHSFEPRPSDMKTLDKTDIFIYTNQYMEPWAESVLKAHEGGLPGISAGEGVKFLAARSVHGGTGGTDDRHTQEAGADPHIWLDFSNAQRMVDTIASAFGNKDPMHRDIYLKNAEVYRSRLAALDETYRKKLSGCRTRVLINGGHFTFGYLADRYGLTYRAAYGVSPDAEPTARTLAELSNMVKEQKLKYIFSEELLTPRVAETIARETGASILKLHGAHNISQEEFAAGTTFIDLMEKNLEQLSKGLECR